MNAKQWERVVRLAQVNRKRMGGYSKREEQLLDVTEGEEEDCVYFFEAVGIGNIKIGYVKLKGLRSRFSNFKVHSPVPLIIMAVIPGGPTKEQETHLDFADLHAHGEWYYAGKQLVRYIKCCEEAVLSAAALH